LEGSDAVGEGLANKQVARAERLAVIETLVTRLASDAVEMKEQLVIIAAQRAWEPRIDKLERCESEHDKRLQRLERALWLVTGVFVMIGVPVILILLNELIQRFTM
jgi:hypothetical protein